MSRRSEGCIIGIRHRIKKTAKGEARPTQVAFLMGGVARVFDLDSEQDELDFLNGTFPTKWAVLPKGEVADSSVAPHHVKKFGEDRFKVPTEYDGLKTGDQVAMSLGGSGDILAFALSLHGERIGAKVMRIPPFKLQEERDRVSIKLEVAPEGEESDEETAEAPSKNEDAILLAKLLINKPHLFQETTPRDRDTILLRFKYLDLEEARKARIACEQRIRQRIIGVTFCTPKLYSQGTLEKTLKDAQANSPLLKFLKKEEEVCTTGVEKALEVFPIYTQVLENVHGIGPKTAARILAFIGDIRRFPTIAKFKAYCGVGLMREEPGSDHFIFSRRRKGEVSNWQPDCRQGFYLMVQYWMKSKDSEWGKKFLEYKEHFRSKHPEIVEVPATATRRKHRKYTKGHIQQMATHRTMTKFAEWMYRQWVALEAEKPVEV